MAVDPKTILRDYARFMNDSTSWCVKESEREVEAICQTINLIMGDVERRTALSNQALGAVQGLKSRLEGRKAAEVDVKGLITELQKLSTVEKEMTELTQPVIEALQFQDRLRQNLENINKIVGHWIQWREVHKSKDIDPSVLQALGQKFLELTTSPEERDIIRRHIPGLAEEQKIDNALFF